MPARSARLTGPAHQAALDLVAAPRRVHVSASEASGERGSYLGRYEALAIAGLLLSLSGGLGARAAVLSASTASQLADLCAADPKKPGGDAALNYCHGFAQAMVAAIRNYDKGAFCFPSPAPTRAESLRQFVRWVRATPDRAKLTAAIGFYRFLREQYPCGKKS